MKVRSAAAVILLSALAVYAGLKWYVYYQTRTTVQRFIEQVSPAVSIEYRGISSTLGAGTVQIDELQFRPYSLTDAVYLRALVLRLGSLPSLFKLLRRADDKTLPASLSLTLQGASASLDGAVLRSADGFLTAAAAAAGAAESTPHCGNQQPVGFAFLRRLGYETLILDVQLRYNASKEANTLAVGFDVDVRDVGRVVVDMQFAGTPAEISDLKNPPPLKEFELVYKDLSYQDRLKRYCMQVAKLTEAQYLDAEVEHALFYRQAGIVPGPGLREAYREFLTKPGSELRLRARPSESFNPRGVRFYQPTEVLQQLNMSVSVNDKPIEDLSFSFTTPTTAQPKRPEEKTAGATNPPESTAGPPSVDRAISARDDPADDFEIVQVGDLARYVNRTVRLHEIGQQPREGILTQVTSTAAMVERRYQGGNIVIKIPLAKRDKAEVEVE